MTSRSGGHERVYRGLLRLYPADYRERYSDQMVQLFADQVRDDGAGRSWLRAMGDLPGSAISEHLRRNRTMAQSLTLAPTPAGRLLGLLGAIGGAFLLLGFINLDAWSPELFNLRLLAFDLGAIAVGLAAFPRHARVSRSLALASSLPVIVANAAYTLFTLKGENQPIDVFILTAAAMWLSDAWFGLITLRLGVLSRWSALALLVGSVAAFAGMGNFGLAPEGSLAEKIILTGVVVQGVAWVVLGLEIALRRRPAPTATA